MISTRRLGWATAALFALVGCDAGVQTGTSGTPIAPTPNQANRPGAPTAAPAPTGEAKASGETKALPVEPAPAKPDEPKGSADAAKLSETELAEIRKLPSAEQAVAIAQVNCPVSGDHLGGDMGVPIKQSIGDKTFYICCSGCEKMVKNKPDEVLAKLKK